MSMEGLPKDFTCTASRVELLKAALFGQKYVSLSFPWQLTAYLYKGKFYIKEYKRMDQ